MAIEVTMPQMGADMTEGTLVRWVKQVGEAVKRGEVIAEIETDKATVELEAFDAGVMLKQAVGEGETVPVGQVIALLGDAAEAVGDVERKGPAATPVRRSVPEQSERQAVAAAAPGATGAPSTAAAAVGGDDGRLRISPVARRIALDNGVDVRTLRGSGPDGRILRRDVEAAVTAKVAPLAAGQLDGAVAAVPTPSAPAPRPVAPAAATLTGGVVPLSRMRQAIARRMAQSKQLQPHYYLTLDVDMTAALEFRANLNKAAAEAQRVSINDLVVKACAIALQRHPKFNAAFTEAGLEMHERVNVDIGIALDEGLIAPALLNVESKSLGRIAEEAKGLIERAKSGHLRADEYSAGTFTITNLGAYGVEMLIGIINPPQAAILGVGSVLKQAVVRDGQVVARDVMKIALSADHRVTDGAEGARFIKEIQGILENPASLAL